MRHDVHVDGVVIVFCPCSECADEVAHHLDAELRHLPDVVFAPRQSHCPHLERTNVIDFRDQIITVRAVVCSRVRTHPCEFLGGLCKALDGDFLAANLRIVEKGILAIGRIGCGPFPTFVPFVQPSLELLVAWFVGINVGFVAIAQDQQILELSSGFGLPDVGDVAVSPMAKDATSLHGLRFQIGVVANHAGNVVRDGVSTSSPSHDVVDE